MILEPSAFDDCVAILAKQNVISNALCVCGQSYKKSINAVSRGNFGIVIGVHPSTLKVKKIIFLLCPTRVTIEA